MAIVPPTYNFGGTWGGSTPRPPTTNYPTTAQQTTLNQQGMPGAWGNWFGYNVAPLATYYTPERGGEGQASKDYYNFANYWTNKTGRPLTAEDLQRFMVGFQGYASNLGRGAGLPDLYDYAGQALGEPLRPPQVSYLKIGEW